MTIILFTDVINFVLRYFTLKGNSQREDGGMLYGRRGEDLVRNATNWGGERK